MKIEPYVSIALRYTEGIKFLSAELWKEGGRPLLVHIRLPKDYVLLDASNARLFGGALLHLADELEK